MIGILDRIFGRKPVEAPKPVQFPRPGRHDMTLERWQTDEGLVKWARTSEEFAYALSVMVNLQPSGFPIRGQSVTDMQCAVELGRKEGYADCQSVLFSLRQFPAKAVEDIQADYDNTEYPETNEG
jgi:hypothetical protein